jgi:oleate hydratase
MEAAYQLLGIERGVPEVFNSTDDVRKLMDASSRLRDSKELHIPMPELLRNCLLGKLDASEIGELMKEFHLFAE